MAETTGLEPFSKVTSRACRFQLPVGPVFKNCDVTEPLSIGGMGPVCKARATRPNRFLALKLLRKGLLDFSVAIFRIGDTSQILFMRRFQISIGLAFLALTFLAKPCAARFFAANSFPTSTKITTLLVVDINEDGLPDVVAGDASETELSVLLGKGDGSFGEFTTFPAGLGVAQITAGDFNEDGHIDLATADASSTINILQGRGDGTFAAPNSVIVHTDPQGIKAADLNGDGHLDLAVAIVGADENGDGELAVLLGKGDGTFESPVYYRAGQDAKALALADLNGDGKLDATVADETCCGRNSLSILLGNGDGTFQRAVSSIPGTASDVAAGDLNGDGKADLVLASETDELIQVALGNGDGTFQAPTSYPMPDSAFNVTLGDINGDGLLDIAVNGFYEVNILLGNGDGSFPPLQGYGVGSYFIALADLNNDQVLDAVAGGNNLVGVALGNPHGVLAAARTFPVEGFLRNMVSGDFNGDGVSDVAEALNKTGASDTIMIFLGDGHGGLTPGTGFSDDNQGFLVTGDFNNDSKLDLSTSSDGIGISIFLGNGDATFQSAKKNTSTFPYFQVAGDFNGDGNLDLASTGNFSTTVQVLLGHGDGFFDPAVTYPNDDFVYGLVSADFDLDGNLDLAVATAHGIALYRGNGDGTFQPALATKVFKGNDLASGDFNRDGKPDLVLEGLRKTALLLGNGDGTFQMSRPWDVRGPTAVADFDGDGNLDLAVADDGFAHVARGNGDGTFRPMRSYFTGVQASARMVFGNLNPNPLPELVVTESVTLRVLLNSGKW